MTILNHFQHLTLTNDQRHALEKLSLFLASDERVFILKGYAGSGKTTILKGLGEFLQSQQMKCQLMAPTGRAAKVINQKTGFISSTVHRGIYSFENLQEIEEGDDVSYFYQFNIKNNNEVNNTIFIVDEASMVSDISNHGDFFRFGSGQLLKDFISYSKIQSSQATNKIIFVGDPAQLPPIGMNFSPALQPDYLEEHYKLKVSTIEMKEVKRQDSDNGILKAATKIRQCLTSGYFNDFDLRENNKDIFNPVYNDYLETYKALRGQKIIICYKNKTARNINKTIRRDKFGEDLPIQPTDTVIVGVNNYRLEIMNGEFAVVAEASPTAESREIRFKVAGGRTESVSLTWRQVTLVINDEAGQPKSVAGFILENYLYGGSSLTPEEQRALYIDFKNRYPDLKKGTEEFQDAITNDKFFNCIQLKYGYAVTCHKAQGGEWENVLAFWDRGVQENFNFYESAHNSSGKTNQDFYRWAYTAITRASQKLICINPPYFSSFSSMSYNDVHVQKAYDELAGRPSESIQLDLNKAVLEILDRFVLTRAPLQLQDHFIARYHVLKKYAINIVGWAQIGYEIRYVFEKEGKTAGVMYWVNGKNEFRPKYRELTAKTNSQEFFKSVSEVLDNVPEVIINRNNVEGILTKVEFDVETEERKPFLKNLFDCLTLQLNSRETISNVSHLEYRDRYTIEKGGAVCVVDFEYNKGGFFGRVLPLENKCNNQNLVEKIQEIVKNLNSANYVL